MCESVCFQCHPTSLCGLYSSTTVFFCRMNSKHRMDQSRSSAVLSPTTNTSTTWHNGDHTQRNRNGKTGKLNQTEGEKSHDVCSPLYFAPYPPSPLKCAHTYSHTEVSPLSRLCVGWHEFISLKLSLNIYFFILSVLIYSRLVTDARCCSFFFGFVWLLHLFSYFSCSLVKKGESAKTNVFQLQHTSYHLCKMWI